MLRSRAATAGCGGSAVLAAVFLNERLDRAGKIGCGLCMIGSIIIVLHAPPEKNITSVNEIVHFIMQPRTTSAKAPRPA